MGSIVSAAVAESYPELISDKIVFLAPISKKPSSFFAALTPLTAILPNRLIGFITTKYLFIPQNRSLLEKILRTTYQCGADYTTKSDVFRAARFSVSCSISDFVFKKDAIFISGEHDKLIPRKKTDELANMLSAKAVYIKNAGHLLNYEEPGKTATAIKKFINPAKSKKQ